MDELRQEAGVTLIFDEIQCGLGRAGMMLGVKLAFPGGPTVDDLAFRGLLANCTSGDALRFLPPLTAEEHHVAEAPATLDGSLTARRGSNDKVS
jgi:acetylornithine/succinyldiaminopimelate/putrescine aminotransferase